MRKKYFLKYQLGTVKTIEILADAVHIQDGCYKFVKDNPYEWMPIAYYPIMQTIIYKVEELNKEIENGK
jgi:hypothetical protein